jgi:ankyrin repeat protein
MPLPTTTTTTGTTVATTSAAKDDSADDFSKTKDDDNRSDTMVLVERRRSRKRMTCRIPDAAMVPVVEKYIEFWFGRGVRQRSGPMNDTPLLEAARHGNIIDVVMVLMHRHVHADMSTIRNFHDESLAPPSTSTSSSRVKTVQINAQDKLGKTALYVTIERMCCASSSNNNNDDHDHEDDLSIVRLLLDEHGANVNVPDHQGNTILHVTAYHGKLWDGAVSSSSLTSSLLGALLMRHGVNVNAQAGGKEGRGYTALHVAALQGHGSTFAWLLQHGADCSIPDHETGCTPLCYLVQYWHSGHERLLHRGLLSLSSSENAVSSDATATTTKEDDHSISTESQRLQGQSKTRKTVVDVINATDKDGWTMLHHVAKWNISRSHRRTMMPHDETMYHVNDVFVAVGVLMEYGANVNAKDHCCGYTPLHVAAMAQDETMISLLLLPYKADVNLKDNMKEFTVLHHLVQSRHALGGRTSNDGADSSSTTTTTTTTARRSLHEPGEHCLEVTIRLMRLVLDHGANVNATDVYGNTALHLAARLGHTSIVQFLLDVKTQTDLLHMVNCFGETALHVAVRRGHEAVALSILVRDEATNAHVKKRVHGEGVTALHLAVHAPLPSRTGLVRLLLKLGADADMTDKVAGDKSTQSPILEGRNSSISGTGHDATRRKDYDGDTALHYFLQGPSKYKHCPVIVHLLVERMTHVFGVFVRRTGETLLHCAAEWSELKLLDYLVVQRGFTLASATKDTDLVDHRGWNPLHVAAFCGSEETIRFLLDHGANATARTVNDQAQTALEIATTSRFGDDRTDVLKLLQQYECRVQQFFFIPRIRPQRKVRQKQRLLQWPPPPPPPPVDQDSSQNAQPSPGTTTTTTTATTTTTGV